MQPVRDVDDVEVLHAAGCGDGFGGCELGSDEKVFDAVAGSMT
jgi:hypothetical protein